MMKKMSQKNNIAHAVSSVEKIMQRIERQIDAMNEAVTNIVLAQQGLFTIDLGNLHIG